MSTLTTAPQTFSEPPPVKRRWPRILIAFAVAVLIVAASIQALLLLTTATETSQVSFDGAVQEVVVEIDAGSVDIVSGADTGAEVSIERRLTSWAEPDQTEELTDGVLRLSANCSGLLWAQCVTSYRATVPADAQVTVRTSAGDVNVMGTGGRLDLESNAGDVDVSEVTSTKIRAATTAGDVAISTRATPQQVEANTTAGDIEIAVPDESYRVMSETTAGHVEVDVNQDRDAAASISASTTAGDITIRPGLAQPTE